MRKCDELSDPTSCLNKANPFERLFILLERDDATPNTIRFWIAERIRLGLNLRDDPELLEAWSAAAVIEAERKASIPAIPGGP